HRRYEEKDLSPDLQSTANYSATYTTDNFQEPHLLVDAGILFSKNKFKFSAGYVYDYWLYTNRGNRLSVVDNYFVSAFYLMFLNFLLVMFTIIGYTLIEVIACLVWIIIWFLQSNGSLENLNSLTTFVFL